MYAFDNAGRNTIAKVLTEWKVERPGLPALRRATPSVFCGGTYAISGFALSRELLHLFPPPCRMTEGHGRIHA